MLIGKPKQSSMNIALQLKEVSEYLSSNGFPSTAQFVDVTKPEPERMDLDIGIITSTSNSTLRSSYSYLLLLLRTTTTTM